MKLLSYFYLLNLCFLIAACNQPPTKVKPSDISTQTVDIINDVSLISLIANPEKYNGQKIRAIGYLHLEFEGNGLYLHKEDYDHGIGKNAIWVDINTKHSKVSDLKKYSNHYVLIEGMFDSKNNGHEAMNSGSLKNVTRLEIWESVRVRLAKK
jgi:hypothetical protein